MMAKYREIQNVLEITIDPPDLPSAFYSIFTFHSNNTGQKAVKETKYSKYSQPYYTLGTCIR